MGRKRKDNKKRDLKLSVDGDLIDRLNERKINKSALFTDAAVKELEKYEKESK